MSRAGSLRRVRFAHLDGSATPGNAVYLFGVLLVDEWQLAAIERDFDHQGELVHEWCADIPADAEFHGDDIFHGVGHWSELPIPLRIRLCINLATIIGGSDAEYYLRGVDTNTVRERYGEKAFPAHELAWSHALESVERRMRRRYPDERVMLFADEHHTAPESRTALRFARDRAVKGKISVSLDHVADTIYFGPSDHSRLLQAVDVATFFYQRFTFGSESHKKSAAAMEKIERELRRALHQEYIWVPKGSRRR